MPDEEPDHPSSPDLPIDEPASEPAPVKKAAAKKAPAKKAAKKAPAKAAKKAPAKRAPRATIMNRISELEERFATDPPPAPVETAAIEVPEVAPEVVPEVAPELRPAKRTPSPIAVLPEMAPPPPALPPLPRAVPPVPLDTELTPPDDGARRRVRTAPSATVRTMMVGVAVLLAIAGGLAAAAYVKDRPATWSSRSVVELTDPTVGGGAEQTAVARHRYQTLVQSKAFTGGAVRFSGVLPDHVTELIKAREGRPGQLVLTATARTADEAARLAEGASRQLSLTVLEDQRTLLDAKQRLGTRVISPADRPVRETPRDRSVYLAGLLGGLDVLLVALMVGLFGTRKPRRRHR